MTPAPAPAPAPAKGPAPVLLDVRCISNPGGPCADSNRAAPGASLRLSGRNLGAAALVVFYGDKGAKDDVTSPATPQSARRAVTAVPQGAHSGPVALIDLAGRRSRRWAGLLVEGMQPLLGTYRPAGMPEPVEAAVSQPRTLFYGAPQRAVFTYRVPHAMDLQVDLVRVTDNAVVRSWDQPSVTPERSTACAGPARSGAACRGWASTPSCSSPRGAAARCKRARDRRPAGRRDHRVRLHVPDPWRARLRDGRGPVRRRSAGHSHQGRMCSRHAARPWSQPAVARSSSPASTPPPATTS